ncbi:hypothetical protein ES707_19438 [subsurface metagenome]
MMPTVAAMTVPMSTVTMARPPLRPPSHRYMASYSRSAIPERSSITPMKTNSGTAMIM